MVAGTEVLAKPWGLQSWGNRDLRRGPRVRERRVCGPPSHPVPGWLHVVASSSLGAYSVRSAAPSSGCGLAFPGCPRPGFLPVHLQLPVSGKAGFLCPPGFGLGLPLVLSLPPPAPSAVSVCFPPTEPLLPAANSFPSLGPECLKPCPSRTRGLP